MGTISASRDCTLRAQERTRSSRTAGRTFARREHAASPRPKAGATLAASGQEMFDVAEERETVLRSIGHELRDPLNTIYMGAALLAKIGHPDEMQARTLERIMRSVDRIAGLVHRLLAFARAQGSGIAIEPAELDLAELCAEVLDEALREHEGRRIHREFRGPLRGFWDQERLGEVFSGLIENALLYGGDPVSLRAIGAPDRVVVEIANGGAPIDGAILSGLFEPFHPLARGLGLSLFLAREIVRAHAGNISVRSDPKEGTCFTVTLPARAIVRGT